MYSAYKLNKKGDNIQPCHIPFPIWIQSIVSCLVLPVPSWPAYRFLRRQVRLASLVIDFWRLKKWAEGLHRKFFPRRHADWQLVHENMFYTIIHSVQLSSVAQSCPTLCDPMNHSTPGLPVHHQLPEFTQIHNHRVGDAIQPSHPLSSPSPPAPNPSQHQSFFQRVNSSHEVAKVLEFQLQHHSLQRNPRPDLLQNGLVGSPCSPRDSQESSPTPQFKSINSSVLSLLHSPTLTSIHDHRKNHSLD